VHDVQRRRVLRSGQRHVCLKGGQPHVRACQAASMRRTRPEQFGQTVGGRCVPLTACPG
jgi:hypothetical protein